MQCFRNDSLEPLRHFRGAKKSRSAEIRFRFCHRETFVTGSEKTYLLSVQNERKRLPIGAIQYAAFRLSTACLFSIIFLIRPGFSPRINFRDDQTRPWTFPLSRRLKFPPQKIHSFLSPSVPRETPSPLARVLRDEVSPAFHLNK